MLQSIIVPLDGSAFAEHALPTAFSLARRHGARVELVMVREPPLPVSRTGSAPVRDPEFDREVRRQARRYLDVLLGRIDAGDRARSGTLLLDGSIVETLASHASATAADLLVMTTHARGGVSRVWLGSVADGVVRRSAIPVLLVRPAEAAGGQPAEVAFRQVLLPMDGSPTGEMVIQRAVDIAGADGVQYTLLRVLAQEDSSARALLPRRGEQPSSRTQRATVEALLDAQATELRSRGLSVRTHTLVNDSAAAGILEYAKASDADLIAMSTRSRGGIERLVLGSVADKVLRGSDRPLLLLNPHQ
jgi:nucleotide-binding universal stress UspA family protein